MSELKDSVCRMSIRGQMNLLYTLCRCINSLMVMAQGNQQAQDTMLTMAETILEQAGVLYSKVEEYTRELSDS